MNRLDQDSVRKKYPSSFVQAHAQAQTPAGPRDIRTAMSVQRPTSRSPGRVTLALAGTPHLPRSDSNDAALIRASPSTYPHFRGRQGPGHVSTASANMTSAGYCPKPAGTDGRNAHNRTMMSARTPEEWREGSEILRCRSDVEVLRTAICKLKVDLKA